MYAASSVSVNLARSCIRQIRRQNSSGGAVRLNPRFKMFFQVLPPSSRGQAHHEVPPGRWNWAVGQNELNTSTPPNRNPNPPSYIYIVSSGARWTARRAPEYSTLGLEEHCAICRRSATLCGVRGGVHTARTCDSEQDSLSQRSHRFIASSVISSTPRPRPVHP